MKIPAAAAAGVAIFLVLSWLIPPFLGLAPNKTLALQLILTVTGLVIAAVILWYANRAQAASAGAAQTGAPSNNQPGIESVLLEAQAKLASSTLGRDARFSRMPVIFVTGPGGAAKTTVVLQSGLDPELLAGQINQDGAVTPTTVGNAWLTRQTALVEVGPGIQAEARTWQMLSKYVQPGKFESAVGKSRSSPRAVLVCYECENLLKPGAMEAVAETAQTIRGQLYNLSATLGANLPVYVLFTKLDRVAFFFDFVRNLDTQEASQILGATLTPEPRTAGVYGERETARLGNAFQELANSLSGRRTELLTRESDPEATLAAYEFPREFRKLRSPLVKFLLEICRPSQLNVGPFLRGFYFSGVRPVVVEEEMAAQASRPAQTGKPALVNPDATGIFNYQRTPASAPSPMPVSRGSKRRVPQWVFLPRFFNEVILADRSGLAASASSTKTNFLRRLLLTSAVCLCVLFGILTLVSFLKNRALVNNVRQASVSVDSLPRLDTLRQSLVQLTGYERTHPPLSMRWGLYTGSAILPDTRRLYFDRFKALLFGDLQSSLLTTMRGWPAAPPANADYGYAYNTLKAYLETTSNHDKATLQFLPPLLQARWVGDQTVDPGKVALARRQFDFYTSELVLENPYSSNNDSQAVEKARTYLAQFAGVARVYQAMLTEANQNTKPVIFNQKFPGSAEVVVNTREIPGGFTKQGFAFMENAIKNPAKYASGDKWVLGDQAAAVGNTPNLAQKIRASYYAEYIGTWRDYLKKSMVVRYPSLAAAVKKLTLTSSPQSPLLALFWLASQNTDVNAPSVQQAFKCLHVLMPPAAVDQYVGPSNSNYMNSLTTLQSALDQASKLPPEQNQAAADQTSNAANAAMLVTRQTALTFGLDPDAHIEAVIQKLMEAPIAYVDTIKPNGASPAPLNGSGADFCTKYRTLAVKYPFDPNSKVQASLDEVNSVFRPQQGALWQFYDQKLSKLLVKQGSAYALAPGGKPELTGRFVGFFNNAAKFSNALYSNGSSQDPKLAFALQPAFSTDLQTVELTIDGQGVSFQPNSSAQHFTWPGNAGGVRATAKSGGKDYDYPNYDGLWGVFEFFADADKPLPSPEWMLKSGRSDRPVTSALTNQPIVLHFNVDMLGGPPVFQKGYFRDLACVAEVAK